MVHGSQCKVPVHLVNVDLLQQLAWPFVMFVFALALLQCQLTGI